MMLRRENSCNTADQRDREFAYGQKVASRAHLISPNISIHPFTPWAVSSRLIL